VKGGRGGIVQWMSIELEGEGEIKDLLLFIIQLMYLLEQMVLCTPKSNNNSK
jgi:hypothetical protein